jgi:hypothetical protein
VEANKESGNAIGNIGSPSLSTLLGVDPMLTKVPTAKRIELLRTSFTERVRDGHCGNGIESKLQPFKLRYVPSARPTRWMDGPILPTAVKASIGSPL